MGESEVKIRLMSSGDFDAVVAIDEKVFNYSREEYYRMKFEKLFDTRDYLPTSVVAEVDGAVVGFVMGELYLGEYGILREEARLDTIGVDPEWRKQGIGAKLIDAFMDHLKRVGVQKVNTLVGWNDATMMRFFGNNKFAPSKTINLERNL